MQKKQTDILFLILDVGLTIENSAVFQAQVADQMIALKQLGYKVSVLCAFRKFDRFQIVAGNKLGEHNIPVHLVPDQGLLKNIFSFAVALKRIMRGQEVGQIYIRGFWAAFPIFLATLGRRCNYVYDVRGDINDESAARGSSGFRLFLIHMLETLALRRAAYITCVTNRLATIIQNRSKIKTSPEVIPSCIDLSDFSFSMEQRTVRRVELGYADDDIVFVYSGGLAHYQMLDEMFALWHGMVPANTHVKFLLMINSDPSSLERKVGSLDDFGNRLKVMNLPRSEVFKTLCAADIGFLLREDRPLNATASPVKFAEYLAAGLAVISSPGVGDLSGRIITRKLGVLVKPSKKLPEVKKLSDFIIKLEKDRVAIRDRSLLAVNEKYSWHAYRNTYQKLYKPSELSELD